MNRVTWWVLGGVAFVAAVAIALVAAVAIRAHLAPRLADEMLDQLSVSGYRKTHEYRDGLSSDAVFVGEYSPEPTRLVTGPALKFSPIEVPAGIYTIVAEGSFGDARYAECSVFVKQLTDVSPLVAGQGLTADEARRVQDRTFGVVVLSVLCVGK
ncbi:MAG TPA: hypothetical protein VFM55_23160 [Micromonosporaceae bacterium]|nr:hypothetical protein [Micromonosporaceae bacterium]